MKKFISKSFLKLLGWEVPPRPQQVVYEKCVIICAPHTSNWDFPIALAITTLLDIKTSYAFKKEAMGFPFGPIFKAMGGLSIDRAPRKEGEERPSVVQAIADLFSKQDKLSLMIAAEGTRSLRKEWKTGFYYIAVEANVPICLGFLDYKTKTAGFGKLIYPSGDFNADMCDIMAFYADKNAKYPEKFSLDLRFPPSLSKTATTTEN